MLKSFRDSLLTTAMAMTPFLLTACGDDKTNGQSKFEIVVLALLCCTVSLGHSWLKTRKIPAQPAV
ncbi:hypothetical protein [Nevskia soli]|uniref:hypothetical protein n=1 Tax=Nevskia soli TaxID=418856 RepID=UPI0004A75742|nr:hypothetical protein [Nevskia soli]